MSNEYEPCPGLCGRDVPIGQTCFDCAARLTAVWVQERDHILARKKMSKRDKRRKADSRRSARKGAGR